MLRDHSRTTTGKNQLIIGAIAKVLEVIPLRGNANFDSCLWESSVIKMNVLHVATEATCFILSTKDTIEKSKFTYIGCDQIEIPLKTNSHKISTFKRNNSKNGCLKIKDFILDILNNSNGETIDWIDKSKKIFKFTNPLKAAFLWGETKQKEENTMDYPKMGRALRYLYDKKELKKEKMKYTFQFIN